MKHDAKVEVEEPVGIVISRGWEPEGVPRFVSFEWSPGPADEIESDIKAA